MLENICLYRTSGIQCIGLEKCNPDTFNWPTFVHLSYGGTWTNTRAIHPSKANFGP